MKQVNKKRFLIRKYQQTDIPQMIAAIRRFMQPRENETNAYSFLDIDDEVLYKYINQCSNNPLVFTRVVEHDGKIVGGIQARLVSYFFNRDILALDEILYIDKDVKAIRVSMRLIEAYKNWAKHHGAKEVMLSNSTMIAVKPFTKLVEACGFQQSGICFKWRPE